MTKMINKWEKNFDKRFDLGRIQTDDKLECVFDGEEAHEKVKQFVKSLLKKQRVRDRERIVFTVSYRGNGYGPFVSVEMARDFAEFIPKRNERKLGGVKMDGVKATIKSMSMGYFIDRFTLKSYKLKKNG